MSDNDDVCSHDHDTITDGWGGYWHRWCYLCGGEMIVIRPGDARCSRCDSDPEIAEKLKENENANRS